MIKSICHFENLVVVLRLVCPVVQTQYKYKMNKLLIVLLAICLVSVHGFVKRDAPAAETAPANQNYFNDLQKQIEDMSKTVQAKLKETLNPDEIMKYINQLSSDFNKEKKA